MSPYNSFGNIWTVIRLVLISMGQLRITQPQHNEHTEKSHACICQTLALFLPPHRGACLLLTSEPFRQAVSILLLRMFSPSFTCSQAPSGVALLYFSCVTVVKTWLGRGCQTSHNKGPYSQRILRLKGSQQTNLGESPTNNRCVSPYLQTCILRVIALSLTGRNSLFCCPWHCGHWPPLQWCWTDPISLKTFDSLVVIILHLQPVP